MKLSGIATTFFYISLLLSCKEAPPRPVVRIIPLPEEVADQKGIFIINQATKILTNNNSLQVRQIASLFTSYTEKCFGLVNPFYNAETFERESIFLRLDEKLKMGKEDYHLSVSTKGIIIEAATANGLFYGIQTLIQLTPTVPKQSAEIIIPAVEIKDSPRFAWRGLHLDVSRHFMPKEFIYKYLDYMAMHKFNVFQWQLSDDQGWRMEIKRYPLLTDIGSIRKKTILGHINDPLGYDTIAYSGYYSRSDIRDIINYATEHYITVVPQIEIPGHSLAALASYPELGCTGVPYEVATRWGTFNDVLCPGKENTYTFLRGVFSEMATLFPGKYFQIGGTDCSVIRWESCQECKQRMKNDSLLSSGDLHDYFIRRVGSMLDSLGKEMVGYDDVLKDTLLTKTVIMSWHNQGTAQTSINRNLQTVMSPAKFCNFDQYQADPKSGPLAVGGMLKLEDVYNYEPVKEGLSRQEAKLIIGAQAHVWTQYMKTPEFVEYMVFPRAAALSEVVWSPKGSRDYKWFRKRLLELIKRYDAMGIKYCKEEFKSGNDLPN